MSTHVPFRITTAASHPSALTLAVVGELDHDAGHFPALLTCAIEDHEREHGATLRDLRLDCADLTLIDSTGLAMLLMLRRRTYPAGITLHLDNRPAHLERMLQLTGTAEYLTEPQPRAGRHTDQSDSAPAP
ncbi:STAS domain-containing protein [Streptomyces sp. NPDC057052]|uniref:STAS domain-containing protein n=1 Tax=Streptomyces sp. NPDC057052 TaxID=3346010 RepID=UPI00362A31C0